VVESRLMAGGNLKPAPLPLTGDLVAKLTGVRPAFGKGVVHLPIEGSTAEIEADDIDWIGGGLEYV